MSLADIWEWISSNVASAWNWLIHADLLVGFQFLGVLVIAVLAVAVLGFIVGQYNAVLSVAYQKYPGVMGRVYWLTLIGIAAFGAFFLVGLALLLAGLEVPGAWVSASFFLALACLLAAMLLRKPEQHD